MHGSERSYRPNWQRQLLPGSAGAYAFATVLVVVASLARWGLGFLGADVFVFAAYYPAVLFATYVGGAGTGAFAVALSSTIALWAFMPHPLTSGLETKLAAYLFASALIVWGANHYRQLMKSLKDEETLRKLAVDELAHRLKNKLATIQSIISFQLREEPEVRDAILRRLNALAATDDLITAAQSQGARLRDILCAELKPYAISRVSMEGPDCLLAPKLALTIALLVHELATNAAKYGAFSNSVGKLSINWYLSDAHLNLEWRESGGPIVSKPSHRGFGTRLVSRSLGQFGGNVDAAFEPAGLIVKLNVVLPEPELDTVPRAIDKRPEVLAVD